MCVKFLCVHPTLQPQDLLGRGAAPWTWARTTNPPWEVSVGHSCPMATLCFHFGSARECSRAVPELFLLLLSSLGISIQSCSQCGVALLPEWDTSSVGPDEQGKASCAPSPAQCCVGAFPVLRVLDEGFPLEPRDPWRLLIQFQWLQGEPGVLQGPRLTLLRVGRLL